MAGRELLRRSSENLLDLQMVFLNRPKLLESPGATRVVGVNLGRRDSFVFSAVRLSASLSSFRLGGCGSLCLLQHHNSPQAYGQAFLYREGALVPFKLVGIIVAYANAILMWLLMNLAIVRSIAAKSMPANSGPSEKSLVNTKVRLDTLATANDGTQAICTLKAKGHPGYLLTARMIVETALTILDDKSKKINPLEKAGVQGGALTPALIGAERLAQRLVEFGHFEITTEKYEGKQVKKTK